MNDLLEDIKPSGYFCKRRQHGHAILDHLVIVAMTAVAALALYTVTTQVVPHQPSDLRHGAVSPMGDKTTCRPDELLSSIPAATPSCTN